MESKVLFTIDILLVTLCSVFGAPSHDHQVAFSAGLTSTLHIQDRTIVHFDKVYVNERLGYDPATGVFTCPLSGLYVLHFNAYSSNRDAIMWLELQLNDKPIVSVSGYNSHTVGSNTVMLSLNHGDRVHIASHELQQFSLFGLPDQVYSTFGGFMLYPSRGNFMDGTSGIVG